MSTPTVTLNDLILSRMEEIAEDAWNASRALRITGQGGRVIDLGTASTWEEWTCCADHGDDLCDQPLLTSEQAATLIGQVVDFSLPNPSFPAVEVQHLAEYGFETVELFHLSDVTAEFRKVNG
ncbi:hypothetical protein ACFYPZ_24650 [Streptomyces sp. NPDC005506]|uniref:hypothetical protein n=1 Tax=Streptomyces sp. NPDC005506 TaxID=3364718 RepID=UPI00369CB1B5